MAGWLIALLRWLSLTVVGQALLAIFASKGFHPQIWIAEKLGMAIDPSVWSPSALLLSETGTFVCTVLWEMAGIKTVDDVRRVTSRASHVAYAKLTWVKGWKIQSPIVRRNNAVGASRVAPDDPIAPRVMLPVKQSEPSVLLKIYKSEIDRQKLDAALYELFQVLNSHAAIAKRNAEYNLIHNWETRFVNDGRGVFLGLIDSVRDDVQTALMHINRVTYGKEYAYYLDELRDALREDQSSNLLGPLDALRSIAAAVPEKRQRRRPAPPARKRSAAEEAGQGRVAHRPRRCRRSAAVSHCPGR